MPKHHLFSLGLAFVAGGVLSTVAFPKVSDSPITATIVHNSRSSSSENVPILQTSKCLSFNDMPDPACTPGVIDPACDLNMLKTTTTFTRRPPASYTTALKLKQMIEYGDTVHQTNAQITNQTTGKIDQALCDPHSDNTKCYEEDHLISLELCGSPTDPKNLWPEQRASPNTKDAIENLCHKKIIAGQISLADAQKQIVEDWKHACQ